MPKIGPVDCQKRKQKKTKKNKKKKQQQQQQKKKKKKKKKRTLMTYDSCSIEFFSMPTISIICFKTYLVAFEPLSLW